MSGPIAKAVYTTAGFVADMEEGREIGVPFCCRLRWSIEWALFPWSAQAASRGVRFNPRGEPRVPCAVLHFLTLSSVEWEQRFQRWERLCQ
jgi:hypothetical protein